MVPLLAAVLLAHPFALAIQEPSQDSGKVEGQSRSVDADELAALSDELGESLAAGDAKSAAALFDWDALYQVVTADVPTRPSYASGYVWAAASKQKLGGGLLAPLARELKEQGSTLRFLHPRVTPRGTLLTFRVLDAKEEAFAYFEFQVASDAQHPLRCTDVYSTRAGTWASEILRLEYLLGAPEPKDGEEGVLAEPERTWRRERKIVRKLIPGGSQSSQDWLEAWTALPPSGRAGRLLRFSRLSLPWTDAEEEQRTGLLTDLRSEYGAEPGIHIVEADLCVNREDDDGVLASLVRLDAVIGGDPNLDHLRAAFHIRKGEHERARELCEHSIQAEPDRLGPHWMLLAALLKLERYEDVFKALVRMDETFEVEWNDLEGQDTWTGFVASPWNARWTEHLARKAGEEDH